LIDPSSSPAFGLRGRGAGKRAAARPRALDRRSVAEGQKGFDSRHIDAVN
jgi:hypothetical protein